MANIEYMIDFGQRTGQVIMQQLCQTICGRRLQPRLRDGRGPPGITITLSRSRSPASYWRPTAVEAATRGVHPWLARKPHSRSQLFLLGEVAAFHRRGPWRVLPRPSLATVVTRLALRGCSSRDPRRFRGDSERRARRNARRELWHEHPHVVVITCEQPCPAIC